MHAMNIYGDDLINQLPAAVGVKDKNSVYVKVNQRLCNFMGFSHPDEVTGLTDFDVKNDMAALAETYQQQDKITISNGEQQHIDIGFYNQGNLQIHLSSKKPLYDNSHNIIGTIYTCFKLQNSIIEKLYLPAIKKQLPLFYHLGGQYSEYKLTDRESECLFYLIRGQSAKTIAHRLVLSPKTIEYYIDRLKYKFDVSSKAALIEKCIQQGFIFNIPIHLI